MSDKKNKSGLVGLGILVAGLAGVYYLYGTKDGGKKKEKIKGWMLKAKGEVLEKLEKTKEVNEETYNELIATVIKKYSAIKSIDKKELDKLGSDLKKHWGSIKKNISKEGKAVVKTVKNVVK